MEIQPRNDQWVIIGISPDVPESDPYDKKEQAAEDMRGMARFLQYEDDPQFILGHPISREQVI